MELVSATTLPAFVAALTACALAAWLLFVDARGWTHRTFAAVLLTFAGVSTVAAIAQVTTDLHLATAATHTWLMWQVIYAGAVVIFVAVVARPPRGYRTAIITAAVVWILALLAIRIIDGDLIATVGPADSLQGIRVGEVNFTVGQAALLLWIPFWLIGPITLAALARLYSRQTTPLARRSQFLLAAAFLAPVLHAATRIALLFIFRYEVLEASGYADHWMAPVQLTIQGALGLAACAFAARTLVRQNANDPEGARRARGWTLAVIGALAVAAASLSIIGYRGPTAALAGGLVALILPVLATYALLRHHLFDMDMKARFTVKSGTVAAIFLAVAFIVSEAAQEFFGDASGNQYWGIAAAGLLVFAIAPLQRFADRVATTAIPDAKPMMDMSHDEKALAYAEVVRMAWLDGHVTIDERKGLAAARRRLALSSDVATEIEEATIASL